MLISTVSQTQGQAIQLAMMTLLPQFLLSGLFFPLYSMPWAVRWIGYVLPLTYFIKVARGVMVRGAPLDALWVPLVVLAVMAAVVFTASTLRFRRELAPAGHVRDEGAAQATSPDAARQVGPGDAGVSAWGLDHVTVRYGRRVALDDVTLEVPAGAVTAVIGGDGAGKSTLLRALAGVARAGGRRGAGPAARTPRLRLRRVRPVRRPERGREHRLRRRRLRRAAGRAARDAATTCSPAPA